MNNTLLDSIPEVEHEEWTLIKFISELINALSDESESRMSEISWTRVSGMLTYCCSVYGISCMAMALILNRTLVMASTNASRNQQIAINRNRGVANTTKSAEALKRLSIVSFRVGVIAILLYNAYNVLVVLNLLSHISIRGDTAPFYRRLLPDKLFAYSADYFGTSKFMKTPRYQVMVGPTTDMYWPIFLSFCLSSFMETFISVVSGKKPYTESGITIFEHSLAFQEFSSGGAIFFRSSKYNSRPTEQVLISTLFSILTHLNIHVGALINNNRYRLVPSAVIGTAFLGYFISSIWNGTIWGFPTILVMTFTPQVLIVSVICMSLFIFLIAIIANGFSIQGLNFASFLMKESNNDETASSLNWEDDFYTVLLNLGIMAITSAGKSSYITELSLVTLDDETWLERSLWQRIRAGFQNTSTDLDSSKVVKYLKENKVSGYGNVIMKPSSRIISNGNSNEPREDNELHKRSVFKTRIQYVKIMLKNMTELLYNLVVSFVSSVSWYFTRYVLRREVTFESSEYETEEQFQARKEKVPSFLRKYMKRRTKPARTSQELVHIDEYDLSTEYLKLLNGPLVSELDNSEDYGYISELSESDSETEGFERYSGTQELRERTIREPVESISPINELVNGEVFDELINGDVDILRRHLKHDPAKGALTRSRYREVSGESTVPKLQKDESVLLLELITSKRKAPRQNDDDDILSSRLDCVICQTNTREIITWPCKCFAICEPCRLNLVTKGIDGCVCCRRDVEGVSKVFIP